MRLVVWSLGFVLGDACGLAETFRWWWIAVAAPALAVAIAAATRFKQRRRAVAFVIVTSAGWLLGVTMGARANRPPALNPELLAALARDDPVPLQAIVSRGPEETEAAEGGAGAGATGARMTVSVTRLGSRAAEGTLALTVVRGWPDLVPGDVIVCSARLRELRGTRNPGLADPTLALRAAGIDALATVTHAEAIRRIGRQAGYRTRRWAYQAHRALRAAIDRTVREPQAGFLRTAVLGERRGVGQLIEDDFRAAGATHVLSVSGLHLAAVAAAIFVLLRFAAVRLPGVALHVDSRAFAATGAIPAIAFFTLLTGEAVATERSALMLSIAMAAYVVGRRPSAGPTIAAAALVLLVRNPLQLLDTSLQLSLASVCGIALLARRLQRARSGPPATNVGTRALDWLGRFAAATAAATSATAPLVAHDFGEIAPFTPFGNLALVPLVELVVVPVGLLGSVVAAFSPRLGALPMACAGWAARATLAVARWFGAHAPVITCRAPNTLETVAFTLAGALGLLSWATKDRARRVLVTVALASGVTGAGSMVARDIERRRERDLVVTFLDVGQGDAAVVEAPGGAVMLIDGGGTRDGAFDTGARIVEPFLRARGIGHLDIVALSHPHPDHLNGLQRIVDRFPVDLLWSSGDDGHNPEYHRLIEHARRRGIATPVVAPVDLGAARVDPLGPFITDRGQCPRDERVGAPSGLSVNDASLVLRVAFGRRAVLFPGDLEADGEGELVGRAEVGQSVDAAVLKVPHHGSRTSSSSELLDAVRPAVAVISLGWRNQFHFPAPEVIARYRARHARILRTDRDGAVTIRLSPEGAISIDCARACGDGDADGGEDGHGTKSEDEDGGRPGHGGGARTQPRDAAGR